MKFVFDLGEQLAELPALIPQGGFTESLGLNLLEPKHWLEFVVQDAKGILREKILNTPNDRVQNMLARLLSVATDDGDDDQIKFFVRAIQESHQPPVIPDRLADGNIYPADTPERAYLESLDDLLDDIYYDIGTELHEFISSFHNRGDLWTVDVAPKSKHMIFNFCCQRHVVEASVVAAGGNMRDFVHHLIG